MTILLRIEQYLQCSGMTATRFGRTVARDPRLVSDLRSGRAPGASLAARVSHWIERHPVDAYPTLAAL